MRGIIGAILRQSLDQLQRSASIPDVPAPDPAEIARLAAELETWTQDELEALAERLRGLASGILASIERIERAGGRDEEEG